MKDNGANAAKKSAPRSGTNLDMFTPGRNPHAEVSNALLNLQRKNPQAFDEIMKQMSVASRAQDEAYYAQSRADGIAETHPTLPPETMGQISEDAARNVRNNSRMGHAVNNPGMGLIDQTASSILDLWKPEALQRFVNTFGINSPDAVGDLWK